MTWKAYFDICKLLAIISVNGGPRVRYFWEVSFESLTVLGLSQTVTNTILLDCYRELPGALKHIAVCYNCGFGQFGWDRFSISSPLYLPFTFRAGLACISVTIV